MNFSSTQRIQSYQHCIQVLTEEGGDGGGGASFATVNFPVGGAAGGALSSSSYREFSSRANWRRCACCRDCIKSSLRIMFMGRPERHLEEPIDIVQNPAVN